jgi:hypothetical protein
MSMSKLVQSALDAEFPNTEPSSELWDRVRTAIPTPAQRQRHRLPRMAVATIWLLVGLTGGVAAAQTPVIKEAIQKLFLNDKQIELKEWTPEVQKEFEQKKKPNGEPVVSSTQPVDPAKVRELVHPEMKLPAYLPDAVTAEGSEARMLRMSDMSLVSWMKQPTSAGTPFTSVMVSMHTYAFGPGSIQGTNGAVKSMRKVQVGTIEADAYEDGLGWNLLWVMDGHQYQVSTIGLTLEEALKVAESLQ